MFSSTANGKFLLGIELKMQRVQCHNADLLLALNPGHVTNYGRFCLSTLDLFVSDLFTFGSARVLIDVARECSSLLEIARICSNLFESARVCSSLLEADRYCSSLLESPRV